MVPDLHPTNIEYSLENLSPAYKESTAARCAFDLAFYDLLGLAADMPPEAITILVATGLHRPNEGDELAELIHRTITDERGFGVLRPNLCVDLLVLELAGVQLDQQVAFFYQIPHPKMIDGQLGRYFRTNFRCLHGLYDAWQGETGLDGADGGGMQG